MAKKRNRSNRPKPRPDAGKGDAQRSRTAKSDAQTAKSDARTAKSDARTAESEARTTDTITSEARTTDTIASEARTSRADDELTEKQADDKRADDKRADGKRADDERADGKQDEATERSDAKRRADKRAAKRARKQGRNKHSSDNRADKQPARGRGPARAPLPEARLANDASVAKYGAAPEPRFWFGFEITWAKLVCARVVIFSLLALDALLLVRHAPRYGATDFNVGQLSIFDSIGPGRVAYGAGQLVLAYSFVLIAFGVATRALVPISAVLYGWLYFGSQLDSYQPHYLVLLVLVIASFESWERPEGATPQTPMRSWALRLLLVQLAIMYLWAAISKLHPAWVNGHTLGSQLTGSAALVIDKTIGFAVASVLVILAELTLAATVWWRRGWRVAAPLGLLFHGGILLTNLEIGLFAGLMVGIYILVVPDRIWVWLAELPVVVGMRESMRAIAERTSWLGFAAALIVGIALAYLVRLENAFVVVIVLAVIPAGHAIRAAIGGSRPRVIVGLAHAIAIVLWLAVDRTSTVAVDYYRDWGGSQRRLQNFEQAEQAYRSMVDVAPHDPVGHYHLGRILVRDPKQASRVDEGLAELRRAQVLEPARARAFVEEARVLAGQGKFAEATVKAKAGAMAEPSNPEARLLVDSLSKSAVPAPVPDTDPE